MLGAFGPYARCNIPPALGGYSYLCIVDAPSYRTHLP